ncbi:phosphotransferase enzyme family protein [Paenibacillus pinihumi]|uniref:phosphotransferase enzyme family protein n=1 Tax=Paenibacillus pinihumi TaxID=669462 RepID=UPI001FE09EC1|nr:phosphotransferase [Paenibacillus pinihumi]
MTLKGVIRILKLKYLFHNEELASMLLGYWKFDQLSLELFKYYRISSNAIYPFQDQDQTRLLRFAPRSGKFRENVMAELEFLRYLRSCGYSVPESIPARDSEELVIATTPWGEYYASVFKRVAGVQLSSTSLGNEIVYGYGQALGQLHRLSSEYVPGNHRRWSHLDVLHWIEDILVGFPNEKAAKTEARLLRDFFATIPATKANYGLIHYDFEYDNVFYDEATRSCHVIDFDDAMYHWYALDIANALDSLQDLIDPQAYADKKQLFMEGYAAEYPLADEHADIMPACRRFASLYGYARTLHSTAEQWLHEPEWMVHLRARLAESMRKKSGPFGIKIS